MGQQQRYYNACIKKKTLRTKRSSPDNVSVINFTWTGSTDNSAVMYDNDTNSWLYQHKRGKKSEWITDVFWDLMTVMTHEWLLVGHCDATAGSASTIKLLFSVTPIQTEIDYTSCSCQQFTNAGGKTMLYGRRRAGIPNMTYGMTCRSGEQQNAVKHARSNCSVQLCEKWRIFIILNT